MEVSAFVRVCKVAETEGGCSAKVMPRALYGGSLIREENTL